jgi:hypothetical protein
MRRKSILTLLVLAIGIVVGLSSASCRKRYTDIPVSELTQKAPFKATVEQVCVETYESTNFGTVAFVGLKTEDGRRVSIGGERATPEIVGFVRSLQRGQTYTFPGVFTDYMKSRGVEK